MEDTAILSNVAVILAITLAFYYYFKASKLAKEIELRDELIESQQTLMRGQLTENDKKIKELQEQKEQECLTIDKNIQEPEDVRSLVREFLEKAPIIDEDEGDDERSQEILQQLMRDKQTKNEAISIAQDFMRWFAAKNPVTIAESNQWDRAQDLLCHLLGQKPMTLADLAKKSPEEQQRYFLPSKTIVG
ncbi:hypothetical protein [Bartonella sp. AP58NXGY]|uniref:hypothetical protein n=1 Tax=Bartonella sp. AP58NXGY TaxID=3243498 RepID=UPI0035CF5836